MNDLANLTYSLLENTMCRGIGNHSRRESRRVRPRLGGEILKIDVAARVGRHDHDFHSAHRSGSGIGAVSRRRNEADVAMFVAATAMISADRE